MVVAADDSVEVELVCIGVAGVTGRSDDRLNKDSKRLHKDL